MSENTIKKTPSEGFGRWIPCSERVPEVRTKSYRVLVICTKQYDADSNYPGEGLRRVQQDWNVRQWPHNYTHWMEVPDLPPSPPGNQQGQEQGENIAEHNFYTGLSGGQYRPCGEGVALKTAPLTTPVAVAPSTEAVDQGAPIANAPAHTPWISADVLLPDMYLSNEHGKWSDFVLVMFHGDPAVCVLWQAKDRDEPRWVFHRSTYGSIPVHNTEWAVINLRIPALLTPLDLELYHGPDRAAIEKATKP